MKLPFEFNRTYDYDELQDLAHSMCTSNPILCFSIFKTKESDHSEDVWNVNAPDIESTEPVILGKVQFVADYWRVSDEPVYSPVVENPTWRVIINIFNDMLQQGDRNGIYLEGLVLVNPKDSINTIQFQIGS